MKLDEWTKRRSVPWLLSTERRGSIGPDTTNRASKNARSNGRHRNTRLSPHEESIRGAPVIYSNVLPPAAAKRSGDFVARATPTYAPLLPSRRFARSIFSIFPAIRFSRFFALASFHLEILRIAIFRFVERLFFFF